MTEDEKAELEELRRLVKLAKPMVALLSEAHHHFPGVEGLTGLKTGDPRGWLRDAERAVRWSS